MPREFVLLVCHLVLVTEQLRLHAIFDSDMVLQRGKPIVIWGWAKPGDSVSVQLGKDKAEAKAAAEKGRWEVTFPAREASAEPQNLTVTAGGEKSRWATSSSAMCGSCMARATWRFR
jgi:hypothetical protein